MEGSEYRRWFDWCVLGVVLLALWLLDGWGGPKPTLYAIDVATLAAPLLAGVACVYRSRRESDRTRTGWMLLGIACLLWAFGALRVAIAELWQQRGLAFSQRAADFPSAADFGFLAFVPFAVLGMALVPRTIFRTRMRVLYAFDATVVALGVLSIVWWLRLETAFDLAWDRPLETALLLAYPWSDVLLVSTALCAWSFVPPEQRKALALVTMGLLLVAAGDLAYAMGPAAPVTQVLWPAGFLAVGVGAIRPPSQGRLTPELAEDATRALVLTIVPLALLAGASAYARGELDTTHAGLLVLMLLGGLVRFGLALRPSKPDAPLALGPLEGEGPDRPA